MGLYLAVEGGGSTTRAGLFQADGAIVGESVGDACNPLVYGVDKTREVISGLCAALMPSATTSIDTLACGISGAADETVRMEIARALAAHVRCARILLTDDLRPLLLANGKGMECALVIAGTGSSILVQNKFGRQTIFGGRGRIFGDQGSAYAIAVAALKAAGEAEDGAGPKTRIVTDLLAVTQIKDFRGVSRWSETATKRQIAAFAPVVCQAATQGDATAQACLREQAESLARLTVAAIRECGLSGCSTVFLYGGVFEHCDLFRSMFESAAVYDMQPAQFEAPTIRGSRAVYELARLDALQLPSSAITVFIPGEQPKYEITPRVALDRLSAHEIVSRMNAADGGVATAVSTQLETIVRVVERAAKAIASGDRLIYVGAGTSGRLGVLDASECPPTFGVEPGRVHAIIAGGTTALQRSVEDAEDDVEQARRDIRALQPVMNGHDVVIGIAASGSTPYTLAALKEAKRAGVSTALLCCTALEKLTFDGTLADEIIAVNVGDEVLPGSTRLKAGTATKIVLNMISTGALTLSGHVFEGYMVGVQAVNIKLRARAARIVSALTGLDDESSRRLLESSGWNVRVATLMHRLSITVAEAHERLARTGGSLRVALDR